MRNNRSESLFDSKCHLSNDVCNKLCVSLEADIARVFPRCSGGNNSHQYITPSDDTHDEVFGHTKESEVEFVIIYE